MNIPRPGEWQLRDSAGRTWPPGMDSSATRKPAQPAPAVHFCWQRKLGQMSMGEVIWRHLSEAGPGASVTCDQARALYHSKVPPAAAYKLAGPAVRAGVLDVSITDDGPVFTLGRVTPAEKRASRW